MSKLTPVVRILLTALASGIAGVSASEDALPPWARVVLAASSAALAGLGIIPPHVPTVTVLPKPLPLSGAGEPPMQYEGR